MSRIVRSVCVTIVIALFFPMGLSCQTYTDQIGLPEFSAPYPVENGYINLPNGNLHLEFPITTVEVRGGRKLTWKFVYDSLMWRTIFGVPPYPGESWQSDNGGWRYQLPYEGTPTYSSSINYCDTDTNTNPYTVYNTFAYTDASGTTRHFEVSTQSACQFGGTSYPTDGGYATDGSGYFMAVSNFYNATVFAQDGTIVSGGKDTNGNNFFLANSNGIDQFGRVPVTLRGAGSYTEYYDVRSSDGLTNTYTLQWEDVPVSTYFQALGGVAEYNGTIKVLQSLTLPTGRSYAFEYDSGTTPGHYGVLTRVTLPTGGQINYTYQLVHNANGYNQAQVRTRNNGAGNWTFTWATLGNCAFCKVTVSDPMNDTVYQIDPNYSFTNQIQYFQGSASGGTLQKTVSYDYEQVGQSLRPIRMTTAFPSLQTKTEYTYDPSFPEARFPTDQRDWPYYSGVPPANPTRHIVVSYQRSAPYLAAHILNRPLSKTIYDVNGAQVSQTTFGYDEFALTSRTGASGHDENYGVGLTVRGNLTSRNEWVNTSGTFLSSNWHYDTLGNFTQTTDAALRPTTYDYSDSWVDSSCIPAGTLMAAFPTTITDAAGFKVQRKFYTCTGLIYSEKDQNDINAGRPGTVFTYDGMNRPLGTSYTDGGQTSLNYNGDPVPPHITKSVLATPNPSIVTDDFYDGLGRITSSQLTSDPEGTDITDTTYDALGRVLTTSNPHRAASSLTDGTTCNGTMTNGVCASGYDALGRLTIVTLQNANTLQTDYSAFPNVVVTDETGRKRQSTTDVWGRLTQVVEPNPSTGLLTSGAYSTSYTYDVLGNLRSVNQAGDGSGSRNRSFTYDSVSRLLDATNPETGFICYGTMAGSTCNRDGYDANSNLLYKTDGRASRISYQYDILNRLKIKSYSDGSPSREFSYDAANHGSSIGRLTHASNDVNSAYDLTYDARGRVTVQTYCIPSDCSYSKNASVLYDKAGHVSSLTYPSGRKITQGFSGAGRLAGVNFDSFNGTPVNYQYYNAVSNSQGYYGYWPGGQIHVEQLGNGTANAMDFNSRLQQTSALAGAPNGWNVNPTNRWMSKSYSLLDGSGHDNGNVITITDDLATGRTQRYGYDYLNRLTTATQDDGSFNQTFSPDPWGNLKQFGTAAFTPNFDSNNRISQTGYNYDAAGNLVGDTFHTYTYDAESRLKSLDTNGVTYTYDADGTRVRKDVGSDATEYIYFQGQPIAEYKPATSDWSDYIFANGKRIAKGDGFNLDLHIYGTLSGTGQFAVFNFANTAGLNGHTIASGDTLYLAQYQPTGSKGGMILSFTDGTNSNWNVTDKEGYYLNDDQKQNTTHFRTISLSALAGKTINKVAVVQESDTAAGSWHVYFDYMSLVTANGTVYPIYTAQTASSLSLGTHTSGETGLGSTIDTNRNKETHPFDTTVYYGSDHLGSARLMTTAYGYPIWSGIFLPFGQEWNPQITANHYKFTGKERDTESNLDNFGFRYYGSSMGRFMSPDEPFYDGDQRDPQKLNLYSYVRNNPLNSIDPDGHLVVVCTNDENGKQQCTKVSDRDYYNAVDKGNNPGINAPKWGRSGDITCGGVVCGHATYMDEGAVNPLGERYLAGAVMGVGIGRALGGIWSGISGWFGRGAGETAGEVGGTAGATAGKATIQDILQGAVDEGGSRAQVFSKPGGFAQATKDFEALEGQSQNLGRVQVKDLPGGKGRAVLRNFSSDGRPTLEIQPAGGGYKSVAIRYNP